MAIGIVFGALAKPLKTQLREQGARRMDWGALSSCQEDADALTRLMVRGLLSERAVHAARRKLVNRIAATITDHRALPVSPEGALSDE